MSRSFKIEVTGYIRADAKPQVELHDWVNGAPWVWDSVKVDIEHVEKHPSAKGSSFEREFCKKLSLWVSDGKDPDIFWRTAGSGSMATRKQLQVQIGDVTVFPEKQEKYGWLVNIAVFELKNRDLSLGDLFKTSFQWLSDLITKCIASNVRKIPFVIMKSDGALCTFTIIDVVRNLEIDHFNYKDSFVMFDMRQLFKSVKASDARDVWEEILMR